MEDGMVTVAREPEYMQHGVNSTDREITFMSIEYVVTFPQYHDRSYCSPTGTLITSRRLANVMALGYSSVLQ